MKYIIANWKQNKTIDEVNAWVDKLVLNAPESVEEVKIIIAPSLPFLFELHKLVEQKGLPIALAVQDISRYDNGAHTGNVGASQIAKVAKYAIIGHSERRALDETNEIVNQKISKAVKHNIIPIVCFSKKDEVEAVKNEHGNAEVLFAYEPLKSIGTNNPASIESVKEIMHDVDVKIGIYGGSVDKTSVDQYLNKDFINGFLIGGASLDPVEFTEIIKKVLQE